MRSGNRDWGLAAAVCSLAVACAASPPPAEEAPSSGQSYPAALRLFCDVDRLSGRESDDPIEIARVREDYLIEHVKNPDGIYFLTVFRTRDQKQQAEMLTAEAESAGIASCALVDALKAES